MKRTALPVAVIALVAFLLTWNFASRVHASKDKPRAGETEIAKRDGRATAADSKANVPANSGRGKGASTPIGLDADEAAAITGKSPEAAEDPEGDDDDLPAFMHGKINREEYLTRATGVGQHEARDDAGPDLRSDDPLTRH